MGVSSPSLRLLVSKLIRLSIWLRRLVARIEAGTNGYLAQIGWVETRARRLPLDTSGAAIPWFTYPAIGFLEKRIRPEWRVLEFGAGMGTIWWNRNANHILSLEHENDWFARISASTHGRVIKTGSSSADDYIAPALNNGTYDVIVVDGLFRERCLTEASKLLSKSGVIVLDDSERAEYQTAITSLLGRGFRAIEFHGPQPVSKQPGCTTIFYRDENLLGL